MSGSTVLIVDDEHTLARSAKAFLADHGYETEVASTGEKALELLASVQPDVVFADVRLPGMSGLDLLKRIREFDPVIPVIMVTAYGSIEGAVRSEEHTSELQSQSNLVCRLLLEKKKMKPITNQALQKLPETSK